VPSSLNAVMPKHERQGNHQTAATTIGNMNDTPVSRCL
jgi:hypothetical protein